MCSFAMASSSAAAGVVSGEILAPSLKIPFSDAFLTVCGAVGDKDSSSSSSISSESALTSSSRSKVALFAPKKLTRLCTMALTSTGLNPPKVEVEQGVRFAPSWGFWGVASGDAIACLMKEALRS